VDDLCDDIGRGGDNAEIFDPELFPIFITHEISSQSLRSTIGVAEGDCDP
jgi:hypothetical protein